MSLNRPQPPKIGDVARLLAMDRTTLTANLKPLERRGLVEVAIDKTDKRSRRLCLTPSGRELLAAAVPIWRGTHAAIEQVVAESGARPAARQSTRSELMGFGPRAYWRVLAAERLSP